MTKTTKITKKDRYNEIITILTDIDGASDLIDFCETEIAFLDKKAEKAKKAAAAKKTEADPIYDAALGALTDEFQTISEITAAIGNADITTSKVTFRLNALVEAGIAEKSQVTIPGGEGVKSRKVQAYKLADVD